MRTGRARLNAEDVQVRIAELPGWQLDGDRLRRSYTFDSFATAFGFMASVAIIAEGMDHHPDWRNVYNRVELWLSSHDIGGLSERDFLLAQKVSATAERFGPK